MIVAVIVVRMVKAPVDEIVDVITMRHRLVSAPVSMRVAGRAAGRHASLARRPLVKQVMSRARYFRLDSAERRVVRRLPAAPWH